MCVGRILVIAVPVVVSTSNGSDNSKWYFFFSKFYDLSGTSNRLWWSHNIIQRAQQYLQAILKGKMFSYSCMFLFFWSRLIQHFFFMIYFFMKKNNITPYCSMCNVILRNLKFPHLSILLKFFHVAWMFFFFRCEHSLLWPGFRADSRFSPSQWETALFCNDISHWLDPSLESVRGFDGWKNLYCMFFSQNICGRFACFRP